MASNELGSSLVALIEMTHTYKTSTLYFFKNQQISADAGMFLILIHVFSNSHPNPPLKTYLKCFPWSKLLWGKCLSSNYEFFIVFGKILHQIWASMFLYKNVLIKNKDCTYFDWIGIYSCPCLLFAKIFLCGFLGLEDRLLFFYSFRSTRGYSFL